FARFGEHPRALYAEDRGRLGAVICAFAFVDVAKVHTDRGDVDQNLAIARRGLGRLLKVEHLGPAVAFEDDCMHQSSSSYLIKPAARASSFVIQQPGSP